jgi:hypothetical protein
MHLTAIMMIMAVPGISACYYSSSPWVTFISRPTYSATTTKSRLDVGAIKHKANYDMSC